MLRGKFKKLARRIISSSFVPDSLFYQCQYFWMHGKFCNFRSPKRFSEKIYFRMRYPLPQFSLLADKVLVRDYIAKTIGDQYLVPAFFFTDKVSLSTFDSLPDAFVMKANHSAGQVRIVKDKGSEDLGELANLAEEWLRSDFSKLSREKHYKKIKPQIIFEKALLSEGHPPPDYKLNVFTGRRAGEAYVFIQHMQDRFGSVTQNLYLEDWSPAPFHRRQKAKSLSSIPKPPQLDEMLEVAKILASPFGYMRVDFYIYESQIYIGELTLTPAAGGYKFEPSEWDKLLGEKFYWPETNEQFQPH